MAKKPMSDAQKYRKANARGLDRSALADAKTKAGMIGIDSSRTLSGAAREKRFATGLNLVSEAGALRRESSKIRNKALIDAAKKPKPKGG
jgi:hypothetical protein